MARKTLLTEGEIRQFMKLANLEPIGMNRLAAMGHSAEEETLGEGWNEPKGHGPGKEAKDGNGKPTGKWLKEEEDELDQLHATEDELGAEDALADEEGAELDDLEADDVGADEGTPEELVMSLLDLVADWASDHNVDMSVDGDGAEEGPALDDVDAELDVVDEPLPGGGEETDLEMGVEEVPGTRYQESQDELVNEVAKRVAARLSQQQNHNAMVDELAERIMKRLTGAK